MRVVVVGLGRVGLPTAALLAAGGAQVVGVDRDPAIRAAVEAGTAGGSEPGLGELLAAHPIRVAASPAEADIYLVCVGTPLAADGRSADLSDLWSAIAEVERAAPDGALVVLESTVPVGTTQAVAARLHRLDVAVAPERVLPGDALRELRQNDRVIGGEPRPARRAAELFRVFCAGRLEEVDPRTAELVKLVENAARDVELALVHSVADVARALGIEPSTVIGLARRHPRVRLLEPGVGVGGHCLPVDPWFLVEAAPGPAALFRAAREVNDAVPSSWAGRIAAHPGRIGLLGLAYKPDVEDRRASPALAVARELARARDVLVHDPFGDEPGLRNGSLEEVLACDVVVHLVAHRAYRGLRGRVKAGAAVVDAAGGWS